MGNAGRVWVVCFAVVAVACAGSDAAEPSPMNATGPLVLKPAGQPAKVPADGSLNPTEDRYSRAAAKVSVNTLDATMTANGVVPSVAYEPAPRWITVLGDVHQAGSYEMASETMTFGKLLSRCGGPNALKHHAAHLVRDGRPWGPVVSLEEKLHPGDLIVVQSLESQAVGKDVVLGLVGLSDSPVAVRRPAESATIEKVLERTLQTHLSAADVTVLVDGARHVPMNGRDRLPDCAVLVFNPERVNREQLPELPTNQFAISGDDDILLASQAETDGAENSAISPVPSEPADLSSLPRVRPLGPPPVDEDGAANPPQTADASGAVTIGPPELESHIVPYPSDEFLPPRQDPRVAAAPDPPAPNKNEPVGLPVNDSDSEETAEENSQEWEIWPIAIVGMLLGGGTFYLIRRLRDEETRAAMVARIRSWISRGEQKDGVDTLDFSERETVEVAVPFVFREPADEATMPPADVLTALAANRLTFREERVELPTELFVQGRSSAPARRRVDAGNDGIHGPHLYNENDIHGTRGEWRSIPEEESESEDDILFDSAETISGPTAARRFGTPFEQALAKLRST